MRHKRADIEAAALAFIRASNADDEVFVLNFADEPHLDVPLTSDLSTLEAGMRKLDAVGGTALRDALSGALTYLGGHAKHERRAILIVTDGTDNASRLSKSAIRELCRQAQAAIYAVGLVGEEDRRRAAKGRAELEDLTDATGGLAYFPERIDDVRQTVLGIARQLRNQYTVAYSPSNQVLDGRYRRIELRVVSRRGVRPDSARLRRITGCGRSVQGWWRAARVSRRRGHDGDSRPVRRSGMARPWRLASASSRHRESDDSHF